MSGDGVYAFRGAHEVSSCFSFFMSTYVAKKGAYMPYMSSQSSQVV